MTAALADPDFVEPAYLYKPPASSSLLPKVRKICQLLGETLEPEQELCIEVLTGRKADGMPVTLSGAVICARQNLKTFCLERIVLTLMLEPDNGVELILWTSQKLQTCDETFFHFVRWFEGRDPKTGRLLYPFFNSRLDINSTGEGVDRGKGTKQIQLKDGKRLKFTARSAKSGQGLTGDVVIFDEAFAVDPEHTAALIPTLTTRRRAMVLYGSSACHEDSEVLRGIRDRGRKKQIAYAEWCAPGSFDDPGCQDPGCQHLTGQPGCVLDDPGHLKAANPMLDRRIEWSYLAQERLELGPDEFARERLGWHDNPLDDQQPISVEAWDDLATTLVLCASHVRIPHPATDECAKPEALAPTGSPVFFVDCSPNLKSASIAGAAIENGKPHARMADYRSGTAWLPAKIAELRAKYPHAKWQFEASSPFSALAEHNEAFDDWRFGADKDQGWPGIIVEKPFTANDMARGCGHLQKMVNDRLVTHSGDPMVTAALRSAIKRDMGDPGLWSWGRRKSSGDISPLVAVTGALWLLESGSAGVFFFSRR